ncbi:hypothetical protein PENTCL1PPCAC_21263, partial [Pristionchus entomophagus]
VKPPTKLLSTGQYSMKELLKAQARAVAVQPARIDTTGLLGAVKRRVRPNDMPRLDSQALDKRTSEWSRLERVVEAKLAEQKAQVEEEKKKQQKEMIDHQVMADCPPPLLDPVEEMDDLFPRYSGGFDRRWEYRSQHGAPNALPEEGRRGGCKQAESVGCVSSSSGRWSYGGRGVVDGCSSLDF